MVIISSKINHCVSGTEAATRKIDTGFTSGRLTCVNTDDCHCDRFRVVTPCKNNTLTLTDST